MTFPTPAARLEVQAHPVIGTSRHAESIRAFVEKAQDNDRTVLLLGETGSGKDHTAETIHNLGKPGRPFVHLNCGGFPEHLLESELFGHKRGAFTDAYAEKPGLFEAAEGGTIFFDEITNMPLGLQARILRVIEKKAFRKLGTVEEISVRTRIIAATNAKLEDKIRKGEFREDLYYRISKLPFTVPPLRERSEDIPALVGHLLEKEGFKKRLSTNGLKVLINYSWPGNIRQLATALECGALDAGTKEEITEDHLKPYLTGTVVQENVVFPRVLPTLRDLEVALIKETLVRCEGRQEKAGKLIGLNSRTMSHKILKFKLRDFVASLREK